ncbi:hypothetical protein EII34_12535 [Arachnia propionica]|uniref:TY-Chap N-terminal domain-containing protein n=1 Tax=Arachnia propionica TaxID=1750 RepID=A0A3P1T358_9ACTN|nr:hypothetical protein [Arachnia propionica]MDO5083328.1 hypothetical protein [Arachnia propionica]RRD03819.1 hypothetical protein EII34_12535 [Arachnia propionica]
MDWNEFASKLLHVMIGMETRRFLVLSQQGAPGFTVQMTTEEDALQAQCWVRGMDLGDPAVVARLEELGWKDTREIDFWNRWLDLPAPSSSYRQLVDALITTMRELQGVTSPDQLAYRSWREPERRQEGRVYTPEQIEDLDPGEIPLPLDLGGIPALPV